MARRKSDGGGKKYFIKFSTNPSVSYASGVSLRVGHAPAMNVRRTFIHYRRAALLPNRGAEDRFLPTSNKPNLIFSQPIIKLDKIGYRLRSGHKLTVPRLTFIF